MELLDRMLGHDRWTTTRFLELSRDLTDAQLDQPFDVGHRSLRSTFGHMIAAVEWWTAAMTGQPAVFPDEDRPVAALLADHERSYAVFAALARQLSDEQRLDQTFVDNYDWPQTFGGTILHVVLHNAQHRGEVLHILERLGVADLPEGDPQEWEHATGVISPAG